MKYALIENNKIKQYPITGTDLIRMHPNTSFPAGALPTNIMLEYGCVIVQEAPPPPYDSITHKVVEGVPTLFEDEWTQTWNIISLTPDEAKEVVQTLRSNIINSVQVRLDEFAQTRNYDGILSACTYATSTISAFQQEGQRCLQLRDETWAAVYAILADVHAGIRRMPTNFADIETLLPPLSW